MASCPILKRFEVPSDHCTFNRGSLTVALPRCRYRRARFRAAALEDYRAGPGALKAQLLADNRAKLRTSRTRAKVGRLLLHILRCRRSDCITARHCLLFHPSESRL